jgi:molybdenum cofactor synthesis domain-containing protein
MATQSRRGCSWKMNVIRAAVVTISDKGYMGQREDVSGPLLADSLGEMGAEVVRRSIVPDEREEIVRLLVFLSDEFGVDLVLTTGGTGVTPRDVTPEATRAVIEREMPGLAEVLRLEGYRQTPLAAISRGVAGTRGRTLIVNLPGSPNAVRQGMETLSPILPHAVRMIRGEDTDHG